MSYVTLPEVLAWSIANPTPHGPIPVVIEMALTTTRQRLLRLNWSARALATASKYPVAGSTSLSYRYVKRTGSTSSSGNFASTPWVAEDAQS